MRTKSACAALKRTPDAYGAAAPASDHLPIARRSARVNDHAAKTLLFEVPYRPSHGNDCDLSTARYLARKFGLQHIVVEIAEPTLDQQIAFSYQIGQHGAQASASIYHYSLLELADRSSIGLFGFGGEVTVAYYIKPQDYAKPPGGELLGRMNANTGERDMREFERWVASFPFDLDWRLMIELAYIENRLSSWAAPAYYGVAPFRAINVPFCDRRYIEASFALPYDFRKSRASQMAMIACADPDLVGAAPFESLIGFAALKRRLTVNRFWDLRKLS